jgi:hypothetical protein
VPQRGHPYATVITQSGIGITVMPIKGRPRPVNSHSSLAARPYLFQSASNGSNPTPAGSSSCSAESGSATECAGRRWSAASRRSSGAARPAVDGKVIHTPFSYKFISDSTTKYSKRRLSDFTVHA